MGVKAFDVTPVYVPGTYRSGRVFYDKEIQRFAFVVVEADGDTIVAAGGAEREISTTDQLIAASFNHLEWSIHTDLLRKLRTLELERYEDPELRLILGQVWGA